MEACQIGPSYIPVPVPVSKLAALRAKLYTQGGTRLHQVVVVLKYTAAILCVITLFALAVKKYRQSQQEVMEPLEPPLSLPSPQASAAVCNVHARSFDGSTPLMWAANNESNAFDLPAFSQLLDAGANIHLVDNEGRSVFSYLSKHKLHEAMEQLKEVAQERYKMDPEEYVKRCAAADEWRKSHQPFNASDVDRHVYSWVYNYYVFSGKALGATITFEDVKGFVEQCLRFRQSAFMRCLEQGNEMIYGTGWTPLMEAALDRNITVVEFLLKMEVDITVQNQIGQNALMVAAAQKHTDVMALLLTQEVADKSGDTALMYAVKGNNVAGVKLLLTEPGLWIYKASADSKLKALQHALYYQEGQERHQYRRKVIRHQIDPQIVQMLKKSLTEAQEDAQKMGIFMANKAEWKASDPT